MHVCVTIMAMEKQYVLHILSVCICNLSYPAYKGHVLCYTVTHGLSGSTIFFYIIS